MINIYAEFKSQPADLYFKMQIIKYKLFYLDYSKFI